MDSQFSSIYNEHIEFRLQSVFDIFEEQCTPNPPRNLLTVSKNHAVVFAASSSNSILKVFIVNNLLDRQAFKNKIYVRDIEMPGQPSCIACNNEGELLAVSCGKDQCGYLTIYSVASTLTKDVSIMYNIILDPYRLTLARQILWCPLNHNKMCIVTLQGKVRIYNLQNHGDHEVYYPDIQCHDRAGCGCWSPKGHKIVFGFRNGNLKICDENCCEEKTIFCPLHIHPMPFETIAIHWLANQPKFITAFLEIGDNTTPYIYMVDARKSGVPTYIRYDDINCRSEQRYNLSHDIEFLHIQPWRLCLIMSASSFTINVLGTEMNRRNKLTWRPYCLPEGCCASLLWRGNLSYPSGLALHHLSKSNGNNHHPMPSVYVISSIGQLFVFSLFNSRPNAAKIGNICSRMFTIPATFKEADNNRKLGNNQQSGRGHSKTEISCKLEGSQRAQAALKDNETFEVNVSQLSLQKISMEDKVSSRTHETDNILAAATIRPRELPCGSVTKQNASMQYNVKVEEVLSSIAPNASSSTLINLQEPQVQSTFHSEDNTRQSKTLSRDKLENLVMPDDPTKRKHGSMQQYAMEKNQIGIQNSEPCRRNGSSTRPSAASVSANIEAGVLPLLATERSLSELNAFIQSSVNLTTTTSQSSTSLELTREIDVIQFADHPRRVTSSGYKQMLSAVSSRIQALKMQTRTRTKATQVDSDLKLSAGIDKKPWWWWWWWLKKKRNPQKSFEYSFDSIATQTDPIQKTNRWMWFRRRRNASSI